MSFNCPTCGKQYQTTNCYCFDCENNTEYRSVCGTTYKIVGNCCDERTRNIISLVKKEIGGFCNDWTEVEEIIIDAITKEFNID